MMTEVSTTIDDLKHTPTCDVSLVYNHSLYPDYSFPYTNRLVVKFYNVKDMAENEPLISSNIITLGAFQCYLIGRTRIGDNGKGFTCSVKLKPHHLDSSQWIKAHINMSLKHRTDYKLDSNNFITCKFNVENLYDSGYWTVHNTLLTDESGYYNDQCLTLSIKFTIYKTSLSQQHPLVFNFANNLLGSKVIDDHTIVINRQIYPIFYDLVNQCCPRLLLDWTQSLINKANLSPNSINRFLHFIHRQSLTKIDDFKIMLEMKWLFLICDMLFLELAKEYDDCVTKLFTIPIRDQIIGYMIDTFALAVLYPIFIEEVYALLQQFCNHFDLDEYFFEVTMQKIAPSHFPQFLTLCMKKFVKNVQIKTIEIPKCKLPHSLDSLLSMLSAVTIPALDPHNYDDVSMSYRNYHLSLMSKPDFILNTVDGGVYNCHKWFLYAGWSYFKNMLDFGGKEAMENQMLLSEDWTTSRLQQFLRYLYAVECDFKLVEDAFWLLQYGQCYGIIDSYNLPATGFERLVESCINLIRGLIVNLNVSNSLV